jgi:hypothetical protein
MSACIGAPRALPAVACGGKSGDIGGVTVAATGPGGAAASYWFQE